MKTVDLQLIGLDGNAFALMGAFRKQARRENWTKEEIDVVIDKCQDGDYNHLLVTLMEVCSPVEEEAYQEAFEDDFEDEMEEERMDGSYGDDRFEKAKELLTKLVEFDGMPPSQFEAREAEHDEIVKQLYELEITDREGGLVTERHAQNEEIMEWYTHKFC